MKKEINVCYIIVFALFYLKQISFNDVQKICNYLSLQHYNIDYSEQSILNTLKEWKDFILLNEQSDIEFNKKSLQNKDLIELIFIEVLDDQVKHDIFNAIIHRNKIDFQDKIIKFK